MATANLNPGTHPEPELNLLMPQGSEQSLIKSLFQNLDDFFFPKKLPPLQLQSKPIPVRDIWGFYDYKKNGVLGSTILHVVVLAAPSAANADHVVLQERVTLMKTREKTARKTATIRLSAAAWPKPTPTEFPNAYW